MAKLIYSIFTSLDGYTEDAKGNFDWAEPDEEVHAFANEQERSIGTSLMGRRMYETMRVWEDMGTSDEPRVIQEYAEVWKDLDKVVYSTTLGRVTTARTRLERSFDRDAVRTLKDESTKDLAVSGPNLAAHALRAGVVDEIAIFISPVIVGGGNPLLPHDLSLNLELLDERRFAGGVVYLRYRVEP